VPGPLADVQLHLVDSIDSLWAMKQWAGERRETPLAFDTESSGLSPERDRLRLIQLGDMNQGWALSPEWSGGALEILRGYEGDLVAHNLPHDYRFLLRQAGLELPWHKLHDTLILASLDDPVRARGLKPLAKRLIDPQADSGQRALDEGMKRMKWDWGSVPVRFGPYWIYSALDPVLTAHLWKWLHPRVMRSCPGAYDVELGVNRICTRMMLKGMMIDREYIAQAMQKLRAYCEEARTWLSLAYDVTSVMSARQISRALTEHGEPPAAFTPTGLPQIDKEFLARIRDYGSTPQAREIAQQVLGVRHAEKMMSAYLENFTERADAEGVVRCSIWQAQAVTGRMSVTEPALQTLSRDDTFIRGSFVPRPGHVFISCDYAQVEARLAAHFSRDADMIETFLMADAGGTDFFAGIASQIWEKPVSKKDQERQLCKNVVYGACFGAGVDKMAQTAGVSSAVMRPVKEAFDARYPGLRRFTGETVREARRAGKLEGRPAVRSGLGRYLPVEAGKEYVAVNRIIQAEAAEVLKRALLDAEAAGLGDCMILPIHDEILFEVPAADAEEARVLIEETMTDKSRYRVPLTCSAEVLAERWVKL
jgi:DNA polymerase I-like protein with 3'-5' exonuclease and polymerase domains